MEFGLNRSSSVAAYYEHEPNGSRGVFDSRRVTAAASRGLVTGQSCRRRCDRDFNVQPVGPRSAETFQ